METLSEEAENRKLLKEGLKEGAVKMRYIIIITIGPPELCTSTICAETPIRIEVKVRVISDIKLRTSGEQWIEVNNEGMLELSSTPKATGFGFRKPVMSLLG